MKSRLDQFAACLKETLAPACAQIAIAGGLRRGKPDPHDVEICALPFFDTDLFGAPTDTYSHLDALLDALVKAGTLQWDEEVKRRGPRYKRFVVPELDRLPVELFLAHRPENWGVVLAIRTGDAEFSKAFMTPILYKGLMPQLLAVKEGCLYRYPSWRDVLWAREHKGVGKGTIVPCCTELDFFNALRLPVLPPAERNAEGVAKLREIVLRSER
jgi:DNA polymerase/3'-5' exonuclease PolX